MRNLSPFYWQALNRKQRINRDHVRRDLRTMAGCKSLCFESLESRRVLAVIAVTITDDTGPGSLRDAIIQANADAISDTITFNILGSAPYTISPLSALPEITQPLVIDGSTQPGYAGSPLIMISGSSAGAEVDGLRLLSSQNVISALNISGFSGDGVEIVGSSQNQLLANWIGINSSGSAAAGNATSGIRLSNGAHDNIIGSNNAALANVVSGNLSHGIVLTDSGTTANRIFGNMIGTNPSGTGAIANLGDGIHIENLATSNTIGQDNSSELPVTSNLALWLDASKGVATSGANVQSWLDASGQGFQGTLSGSGLTYVSNALNGRPAVRFSGSGGLALGGGQVLTSQQFTVISVTTSTRADGNLQEIFSNWDGTNSTTSIFFGTTGINPTRVRLSDALSGGTIANPTQPFILTGVNAASSATIYNNSTAIVTSGTALPTRNLTTQYFVGMQGTLNSEYWRGDIAELLVFNRALTSQELSDTWSYLNGKYSLNGATPSTLNQGRGNVISGNAGSGVQMLGEGTTDNLVIGNFIGTNAAGNSALPNGEGVGVRDKASGNRVGMAGIGTRNIISGNAGPGVEIEGIDTNSNAVVGNFIGVNALGNGALANARGVLIQDGASFNTLGGIGGASRNVISGNSIAGVQVHAAASNSVQGNYIGTNPAGNSAIANSLGVYITAGAQSTTFGGSLAGSGNLVSGNASFGMFIAGIGTSLNVIAGNRVGLNALGTAALANSSDGIYVEGGATQNLIGTDGNGINDVQERNVVSGNLGNGLQFFGGLTNDNRAAGNYFGLNAAGTAAIGNNGYGVMIGFGPAGNRIGTDGSNDSFNANERNVISGNRTHNVGIFATNSNIIAGNYIGLTAAGTATVSNPGVGILVNSGAKFTQIGTDGNGIADVQERNVIAGHTSDGIIFENGNTTDNYVAGNYIGTNAAGTAALPNRAGVRIRSSARNNRVGTDGNNNLFNSAERNYISGNSSNGVVLEGGATFGNRIAGNVIGLSTSGGRLPNFNGIQIASGAFNNRIGTNGDGVADTDERNIISGNNWQGIEIGSSSSNTIAGNYIGTNINGNGAMTNSQNGIWIGGASSSNIIGTNSDGQGDDAERNVISGNTFHGVVITGLGSNSNIVAGNYVGTDSSGTTAVPNGVQGIGIVGQASGNIIGTDGNGANDTVERNVISGNTNNGVWLSGSGTSGNRVAGNYIGTNWTGSVALPNQHSGIWMNAGANGNFLGTNSSNDAFNVNERNIISGNLHSGIYLTDSGTSSNVIAGNYIGLKVNGSEALGNTQIGVALVGSSSSNRVGTDGNGFADVTERNVISGNGNAGVHIYVSNNNTVAGNYIGTNAAGTAGFFTDQQGAKVGVIVENGSKANVIGTDGNGNNDAAEGNVISGNGSSGIGVWGSGTDNNIIAGNIVGLNASGSAVVRNIAVGINIAGGAKNTRIGTNGDGVSDEAERNVSTGNLWSSIIVEQPGTDNTSIAGNYLGTDITGNIALSTSDGILLRYGVKNTRIGTDELNIEFNENERNVISGNPWGGIFVATVNWDGAVAGPTSGTRIAGNYIGTNATGNAAIPNGLGIQVLTGSVDTQIGTNGNGIADDSERNIISANTGHGVEVNGLDTNNTVVAGNYIGTDVTGTVPMRNTASGVLVQNNPKDTRIGTNGDGLSDDKERNIIAGHSGSAMIIQSSLRTVVAGNYIGTDKTGNVALTASTGTGIVIQNGAKDTRIGTDGSPDAFNANERNVISGNWWEGINVYHVGTTGTTIAGNYIGTKADGQSALGNGVSGNNAGVAVWYGASDMTIGTDNDGVADAEEANVISGNIGKGIDLHRLNWDNAVPTSNTGRISIAGNFVGTDPTGSFAIPNTSLGIRLIDIVDTTVGGNVTSARNIISGNGTIGIQVNGPLTSNVAIQGNLVGTNATGDRAITNSRGILIDGGASNVLVGTDGNNVRDELERNVVSGNTFYGIRVTSATSHDNVIAGNYIGTDITGTMSLNNGGSGVNVTVGATDTRVGTDGNGINDAIERNVIATHPSGGIALQSGLRSVVAGNYVGVDVSGTKAITNQVGAGVVVQTGASFTRIGTDSSNDPFNQSERNIISGASSFGIYLASPSSVNATIAANYIGTDVSGTNSITNDTDIQIEFGVNDVRIGTDADGIYDELERNVIASGGSFGINIRNAAFTGSIPPTPTKNIRIAGNAIGFASDLHSVLGKSDSAILVQESAQDVMIGGSTSVHGNLIGGTGTGIDLKGDSTVTVQSNRVGVGASDSSISSLTYGIRVDTAATGKQIGGPGSGQGNLIVNTTTAGLRLLGNSGQTNSFQGNQYNGHIGLAIDAGDLGATVNDGNDAPVIDYAVLSSAEIVGDTLVLKGFGQAGKTFEFYVSDATENAIGQGKRLLGSFVEGSAQDQDPSTGAYGPVVAGRTVSNNSIAANRFLFVMPLPVEVLNGTPLTALTVGSTSEFSPIVLAGDVGSSLAPQIALDETSISVLAGESISVSGSFYDPDSISWTATVDYGDGSGLQPVVLQGDRSFQLEHTYASEGNYQATLRIMDNTSAMTVRKVSVAVQNQAPTATFNLFTITSPVSEGQAVVLTGQFTDTSGNYSAAVDWGDGVVATITTTATPAGQIVRIAPNTYEIRAFHTYVDDSNLAQSPTASDVYRVVVTVSDGEGVDVTPVGLFLEEVRNVLPSALSVNLSTNSIFEGQSITVNGSFIDPGQQDTHRVRLDWGDGTSEEFTLPLGSRSFAGLSHQYANDPTLGPDRYTITVSVADDDGPESPATTTRTIEVANAVPRNLAANLDQAVIPENGTVTLSGSFADPGALDDHTVTIDWGDGSSKSVLNLSAGQTSFSGLAHSYLDNSGGTSFTIQVSVHDNDSVTDVSTSLAVVVQNVAPAIAGVSLVGGLATEFSEGDTLTITGSYADQSSDDRHTLLVAWGDGTSSLASVNSTTRTFTATHRYEDNGSIAIVDPGHGVIGYQAQIVVTITDDEGASAVTTLTQRVDNVAPQLEIAPAITNNDPNSIALQATTFDPGLHDAVQVVWQAFPAGIAGAPMQTGSGPDFVIDRSAYPTAIWRVNVTATDKESAQTLVETALFVGTNGDDNLVIDDTTFASAGVNSLLVLGMDGDDILDGTRVASGTHQLILDGGNGTDWLFGGAGNDIYYLWRGNDNANVSIEGGPTPVELGNDRYKLKPNSTLTVIDRSGANTLDFGLADYGDSSGIVFDLSAANSSVLTKQDVSITQPNAHFVSTLGTFSTLVGSAYGDRLVAASHSQVEAGAGADALSVKGGTVGASLSGGRDDDVLTITGLGIAELSFEGDAGADLLTNLGTVDSLVFLGGADDDMLVNDGTLLGLLEFSGDLGIDTLINNDSMASLEFGGGADDDLLQNFGSVTDSLNFGGDDGLDVFLNAGSIHSLSFVGGADDDLLLNNGSAVTTLSFIGDSDLLLTGVGTIDTLSFEGDDGADVLVNLNVIDSLDFSGGADDDLFINHGAETTTLDFAGDNDLLVGFGSVNELSFEGDAGSDLLSNLGTITELDFLGGADDDLLANSGLIVTSLDFEGDAGSDGLFNTGSIAAMVLRGGADDDLLINNGPVATTLDFAGDTTKLVGAGSIGAMTVVGDLGADLLVNLGNVGSIDFTGGADDDRLINVGSTSVRLSFGEDSDLFLVGAGVVTSLEFNGDLGADLLQNTGTVTELVFTGGADNDRLLNQGRVSGKLNFAGGADDDLLSNDGIVVGSLDFAGDLGIDTLINAGTMSLARFTGGADNDLLINSGLISSSLDFGGDLGVDLLQNTGTITSLNFGGGADDDSLLNLGTIVDSLNFGGDEDLAPAGSGTNFVHASGQAGADRLTHVGRAGSIRFLGGGDDDLLENLGIVTTSLSFEGDVGVDTLINRGEVDSITFSGGADDDILYNAITVTTIDFDGGADDDALINLGNSVTELDFQGDLGSDVLLNNGNQISSLVFDGGADDDVLVSNGTGMGSIRFVGDNGIPQVGRTSRDTLIVRGSGSGKATSKIVFEGGYDIDAFENNAGGFDSIDFLGGADDDALLNNASDLHSLSFFGDLGSDVIVNHGASIDSLVFTGGADDDVFVNDGPFITSLSFDGGADDDLLINSGNQVDSLAFAGGADADMFVNTGDLISSIDFLGGADADFLVNDGAFINALSFSGDQGLLAGQQGGNDRLWNRKSAVGVGSIVFTGDIGADSLINDAVSIGSLSFEGDLGSDFLQNNGQVDSLEFDGGADTDFLVNTGTVEELQFLGGADDDSLVNRGLEIDSLSFSGDAGADMLMNIGPVDSLSFEGGADDDLLTNSAFVTSLSFFGDLQTSTSASAIADGSDTLINNARVIMLRFEGGADDDLLQNNGSVDSLAFLGGADDDSLVNNGSSIEELNFFGDVGVDALVNNGNDIGSLTFEGGADGDTLRVNGRSIGNVVFNGGTGADAFTYNAVGTASSSIIFNGQADDDFLAMRGSAVSLAFRGGQGNDRVMIVGSGSLNLSGEEGNDYYAFISNPLADVIVTEPYTGVGDTSADTLDFSSYTGGALQVDLRLTGVWQPQGNGQLRLQLTDGQGIENIIGTSFADKIYGNSRSNTISGADFDEPFTGAVAASRGVTQWVYLDFDTHTNTLAVDPITGYRDAGEHVYSEEERSAIRARVEQNYRGPNVGAPWFDVRVVNSLSEIPISFRSSDQYVTIFFNRTPESGRPGGLASEIDPGNVNLGGYASAQINGLLGGVIVGIDAIDDESEDSDADPFKSDVVSVTDVEIGAVKPGGSSENFIKLSAKIAAHELGHLLGLRHQDAFGPIGSGIHDPPGAGAYKPQYSGPSGGFETFDHLIGSPASIGSTRLNDLGALFFGEREAVKLAFAGSDPAATTRAETETSHSTLATADGLSPVILSVPNTLTSGQNMTKDFFVQLAAINGRIDIDASTGRSQSDWYSFTGRAGELINIDLLSNSLQRHATGADGQLTASDFIDSIVRVWHVVAGQPQLVPYYGGLAENDDIFEPTDSGIVDLILPADGSYYIEVDTFHRYGDALGDVMNPLSPLNTANPNNILGDSERVARFQESVQDRDVGKYQLLFYKFRQANSNNSVDVLKGLGGVDVILGGPGQSYALAYSLGSPGSAFEGQAFTRSVTLFDPGASAWSASSVDYGDGSGSQTLVVNDEGVFELAHTYDDNGIYTITVTIVDDIGQSLTQTLGVQINNTAPTALVTAATPVVYGESSWVGVTSGVDASQADSLKGLHYFFSMDPAVFGTKNYANTNSVSQFNLDGLPAGTHTIYARVIDKDDGFTQYTTQVLVTPRTLSVESLAKTKVYGDADPELTYTFGPLATGDTSSIFSGALSRVTGQSVGSYEIGVGSLSAGGNYAISFTGSTLSVTAAPLTVTANPQTKQVGQADPLLTYYTSGLKLNDSAASVLNGSLAREAGETVGSYAIVQGTLASNSNYVLTYVGSTLSIINNAPTVSLTTPVDGFRNLTSTFVLKATDVDAIDQAAPFTYVIAWGNGVTTTVTGPSTKSVAYTYPAVSADGSFQITVRAIDSRGASSAAITKTFIVGGWTLMVDPLNAGKAMLVVVGSQGSDSIQLKLKDDDYYKIRIIDRDEDIKRKGTVVGDVDRILVYGHAGNDRITMEDDIRDSVEVWGGAGDDDVKGGSGNDILLGEAGDDNLWGGDGRDLVIGGTGADRIHGDSHDDILIAGFTMYDAEFAASAPSAFSNVNLLTHSQRRMALEAIMAEWSSSRSVAVRRQNIMGTGTGPRSNGSNYLSVSNSSMLQNSVFDDGVVDRLWGDSGSDWFFANTVGDLGKVLDDVRDRSSNETVEDLDKWW